MASRRGGRKSIKIALEQGGVMLDGLGPVFIVGAPRSGTTLLQYMLRSHPKLSGPTGESHFIIPLLKGSLCQTDFVDVNSIEKCLAVLHKRWSEFLDTDLHGIKFDTKETAKLLCRRGVRDAVSLVDELFKLNAMGEGKCIWIDKTPYYVRHIDFLADRFPSSKFIHVIRDGRDVSLSMIERKWDFHVFNEYEGARQWEWYVNEGRRSGADLGSRYFEIRYEDLISQPTEALKEICKFIGVEYDECVLNYRRATDPYGKTPLLTGGVKSQNREKWRSDMSLQRRAVFESVAGDLLRSCGYSTDARVSINTAVRRTVLRVHQRACSIFGLFFNRK